VRDEGGNVEGYIKKAKDKNSDIRLMGFGHRVYKNYDPRARVIKKLAEKIINKVKGDDPLLEIAHQLEAAALKDPYFTERKLFPNVDFYSGIIYRSVGIPETFFTVMFALGRLPGWIAQWKELIQTPGNRIGRPRQIYTGPKLTDYTPLNKRS